MWQAINRQNLRQVIRNKAFRGTWKDLSDLVLPIREPYLAAQKSSSSPTSFRSMNPESFSSPVSYASPSSHGHRDWMSALASARATLQEEAKNSQASDSRAERGKSKVEGGPAISPAISKSLGDAETPATDQQDSETLLESFVSLLGFDNDTGLSHFWHASMLAC